MARAKGRENERVLNCSLLEGRGNLGKEVEGREGGRLWDTGGQLPWGRWEEKLLKAGCPRNWMLNTPHSSFFLFVAGNEVCFRAQRCLQSALGSEVTQSGSIEQEDRGIGERDKGVGGAGSIYVAVSSGGNGGRRLVLCGRNITTKSISIWAVNSTTLSSLFSPGAAENKPGKGWPASRVRLAGQAPGGPRIRGPLWCILPLRIPNLSLSVFPSVQTILLGLWHLRRFAGEFSGIIHTEQMANLEKVGASHVLEEGNNLVSFKVGGRPGRGKARSPGRRRPTQVCGRVRRAEMGSIFPYSGGTMTNAVLLYLDMAQSRASFPQQKGTG